MGCASSRQSRYEGGWGNEEPEPSKPERFTQRARQEDQRNRNTIREQYANRERGGIWDLGGGVVLEPDSNVKGAYKLPN